MILEELKKRSGSNCELCGSKDNLSAYQIPPALNLTVDESVLTCATCLDQIQNPENTDSNHWRCLNDSMWNENIPVQVVAWRMLSRLRAEGWPQDLKDMMFFEEKTLVWAQATGEHLDDSEKIIHRDSNGVKLENKDTVVLIKDLVVKGGGFTAKRGTAVRNISLVHDNQNHIEGRVGPQQIVILTQYVKKSN